MKGVFIFRRDLRIHDNIGFLNAIQECNVLYPIFIFTPEQIDKNKYKSDHAIQFMMESLDELKKDLKDIGLSLSFFRGIQEDVVKNIIKSHDIDAVYFNTDYTPYAKSRDNKLKKICKKYDTSCKVFYDYYLFSPYNILTNDEKAYTKFTPYYNRALSYVDDINEPKYITSKQVKHIESKTIGTYTLMYTKNKNLNVNGGRKKALKILKKLSSFKHYEKNRDNLDTPTTYLSAYLKFGCVSIRETFFHMKKTLGLKHSLIRQLFWREFYACILFHNPRVLGKSLKPKYDKIKWSKNKQNLHAWKKGETGFPLIDAGMRQLNATGFMHNRSRLLTASFLVKTLLIDWREGEKYFATQLVDYDPASNNGNWQWIAGTGADSQPYFRIFNPWKHTYDPEANYIKKWIPELKDVTAKDIYTWNECYQKYPNVSYNKPVVDYKTQRIKALIMYKKVMV